MVKNQHYIPQFYLKRFGKDEKIDAYDIKNKKFITNTNVSNFASKRFFYDIELEKLDEHISLLKKIYNIDDTDEDFKKLINSPQYIEKTLSNIEGDMSIFLDKIETDFSLINDENFLATFFIFIIIPFLLPLNSIISPLETFFKDITTSRVISIYLLYSS